MSAFASSPLNIGAAAATMGAPARVGEAVQPAVLKTAARKGVRVRVPPRALSPYRASSRPPRGFTRVQGILHESSHGRARRGVMWLAARIEGDPALDERCFGA